MEFEWGLWKKIRIREASASTPEKKEGPTSSAHRKKIDRKCQS